MFLVSAKIDAEIIQAAQSRGVVGFIVKPFNAVAVLMSIRNTVLRIASKSRAKAKAENQADGAAEADTVIPPEAD